MVRTIVCFLITCLIVGMMPSHDTIQAANKSIVSYEDTFPSHPLLIPLTIIIVGYGTITLFVTQSQMSMFFAAIAPSLPAPIPTIAPVTNPQSIKIKIRPEDAAAASHLEEIIKMIETIENVETAVELAKKLAECKDRLKIEEISYSYDRIPRVYYWWQIQKEIRGEWEYTWFSWARRPNETMSRTLIGVKKAK